MTASEPETDWPAPVFDAVHAVAEDIATLLRPCGDASVPIPDALWTVGEAAAHLAMANELMAELAAGRAAPYGDGTPDSLAAANAASLAAFPERDPGVLADDIVRHARAFTAAAADRPPREPVVTPLGPMDLATLASYLLTHMLGHGYDIARALRRPHMIDRARVDLTLPFLLTAMDRVVDPVTAAGHNARYLVRVRGCSDFTVAFARGTATVGTGPAPRPDCVISVEPVTFLLLALGRRTATGAMLRGKVWAQGRRPWLAPGFPALFTAP